MKIKKKKLSEQVEEKINKPKQKEKEELQGNMEHMISTGSTLLDLALTGGRVEGGGLPGGIVMEIFGASSTGKTVLLCEIAGEIQRQGGKLLFHDPEARLDKQFAKIFDLDTEDMGYSTPDRVPEVFKAVREWDVKDTKIINGVCADSLAALSTDIEMDNDEGDKMGMRRAKEFSEQLRKTCRIIKNKNYLMVCSNQIRDNYDGFEKVKSPGGHSIGFYASIRLMAKRFVKIKKKKKIGNKEVERVVGVRTEFEVYKNSCWKPYRRAWVTILFDYGIDDIRENLQFIKDFSDINYYTINERKLGVSMDKAISIIEKEGLEIKLKKQVYSIWEEIEKEFKQTRKKKKRG